MTATRVCPVNDAWCNCVRRCAVTQIPLGAEYGPPHHEPCIAQDIWDRCLIGADLSTAQGRAALDRALRAELGKIEDADLRSHVGQALARIRTAAACEALDRHMVPSVIARLEALEARCAWLEARLGEKAPSPLEPIEITSIRSNRP